MQPSLFPMGSQQPAPGGRRGHDQLNPAQRLAVTTVDGPVLVIAGAGSGKTRTLVHRLAFLVESGVAPERILLLTFTRKAAQEMLLRAGQLLDASCHQTTGGTFHAVANLLLRRYASLLDYPANFTILDQADAEGIVNLLKGSLRLAGNSRRFPSKRLVAAILSKSVNKGLSLTDLVAAEYPHLLEFVDDLSLIREHYLRFKREHGLMDYDDLLVNWQRLLADFPEVRQELAERFQYLMVDEYQDTNPIQADIVRRLAAPGNNVMVVGDDSQSIYSFRGADFRNIMDFPKLFPGARVIRLEENYRSSQQILSLTNAIIERARERYAKTLFSRLEGEGRPVLHAVLDEAAQARYVTARILALREEGMEADQIAVLFRSGYHSYKLELELTRRQIDFEKRGGLKLTESAHMKDVLAYLRLVVNPADHLSWNRILLQLDRVGPKTVQKILNQLKAAADPLESLKAYPAAPAFRSGLRRLVALLTGLFQPGLAPARRFELVMDFYQPSFERLYPDDFPRRLRDLEQLRLILEGYEQLQDFLDDTCLDPPQPGGESEGGQRLILSTVHSAKGLEWDTVFVIHLADGAFPSAQAVLPEQLEEERRLLYVAATRAKKRLFLVYPRQIGRRRPGFGGGGMSPFLAELPPHLFQADVPAGTGGGEGPAGTLAAETGGGSRPGRDAADLAEGVAVRHPFFGPGTVEQVLGPRTVRVQFARHGRKTLHLDYARLEVVG